MKKIIKCDLTSKFNEIMYSCDVVPIEKAPFLTHLEI